MEVAFLLLMQQTCLKCVGRGKEPGTDVIPARLKGVCVEEEEDLELWATGEGVIGKEIGVGVV